MVMIANGDDAGHCASGLTAQKFREATEEERATYRRWLRGIIFFYFGLLFVSGVAVATYSGTGHERMTNVSVQQTVAAAR
jgi:hypothetical protein